MSHMPEAFKDNPGSKQPQNKQVHVVGETMYRHLKLHEAPQGGHKFCLQQTIWQRLSA